MRMGGGRYHFTLIGRKFPLQAGYMNIHEGGRWKTTAVKSEREI